jgi:hypothetical protein
MVNFCDKILFSMPENEKNLGMRGIDPSPLLINVGNGSRLVDYRHLLQKFGVNEIIRVPKDDYPDAASIGEIWVHYNLPIPQNRSGWEVLMSRIVEGGCRKPFEEEKKPLLSLDNVWKAQVIDFYQLKKYSELGTDGFFTNCIGGANDVRSLKNLIIFRYGPVYPSLTKRDILKKGVTITKLKLVEKVSY